MTGRRGRKADDAVIVRKTRRREGEIEKSINKFVIADSQDVPFFNPLLSNLWRYTMKHNVFLSGPSSLRQPWNTLRKQ